MLLQKTAHGMISSKLAKTRRRFCTAERFAVTKRAVSLVPIIARDTADHLGGRISGTASMLQPLSSRRVREATVRTERGSREG